MIALDNFNRAWTWGYANSGRLGDNTLTAKSSPVLVVGSHSFIQVVHSLRTSNATYGLKANGEVWAWGNASSGGLGDNTTTSKSSPVLVVGGHSFVYISGGAGLDAACYALKANGECWSWGSSNNGNLGNDDDSDNSSPVLVVGNHSFIKVVGGFSFTLALKANGEVWSWGSNSGSLPGALGDNTTDPKSSPVKVVGNHSFIQIAALGNSGTGYGLKANGEVWAWGGGTGNGEVGDNTTTIRSSPVLVVGNHSFIQIGTGGSRTAIALKADGSAWTWGVGSAGELGINATGFRSSPVSVVGNHSFIQVYATTTNNASTMFGLKANGEIWAWGSIGLNGEIGNNANTNRSSPVLVVGGMTFKAIYPNFFYGNQPQVSQDNLTLDDSIQLISPALQDTDNLTLDDSIQVFSGESDAHFGTRILSINPIIFVTDNSPAEIVVIDTTDPENLQWQVQGVFGVNQVKDAVIDENTEYLWVVGANGLVVKMPLSDLNDQTIIDLDDNDDLLHTESYDAQAIRYASTENNTAELYLIDDRENVQMDTDIQILSLKSDFFDTDFECIEGQVMDTDLQVLQLQTVGMECDFKCLTYVLDNIVPIKRTEGFIFLDNIQLEDTDVTLLSVNIQHSVNEKSTATLTLNRRHDKFNYDLQGNYRPVTNQNVLRIEVQGRVEFEGKISNVNPVYGQTESVNILAKQTTPAYEYAVKTLSLPSVDKRLGLYEILVQNPQIYNEFIDPNESNPKKYLGIRVPFGVKTEQSISRYTDIDGLGTTAKAIQANTFHPKQNWTYFWMPTVFKPKFFASGVASDSLGTNVPAADITPDNPFHALQLPVFTIPEFEFPGSVATGETSLIHFSYIGTSLSPVTSDIWVLQHAGHHYQRIFENTITRLGVGKVYEGELDSLGLPYSGATLMSALSSAGYVSGNNVTDAFKRYIFKSEDMDIPYSLNTKNRIYDLLNTSFGFYIGSPPYKTVNTRNGIFIPKLRWEDRDNGLYTVLDASYNYTGYAQRIAELEYKKLQNINNTIFPDTSVSIETTFDAYYYYSIKLLNRINVDNTIESGIFNGANGFPLGIKSINLNFGTMRVTMSADNVKSNDELEAIDGQYPDENDDAYLHPEIVKQIEVKTDMATRLKVE